MGAGLNGIIFDDLEWPLTRVSSHCILTSRISQKRCVLRTKLLMNTNRKPYAIYSWRRGIVVRTLVSAGELSLSCARLLAGWVTTLQLSRPLSFSQHMLWLRPLKLAIDRFKCASAYISRLWFINNLIFVVYTKFV